MNDVEAIGNVLPAIKPKENMMDKLIHEYQITDGIRKARAEISEHLTEKNDLAIASSAIDIAVEKLMQELIKGGIDISPANFRADCQ